MEAMERWLSSQQGDLSAPGLHLLEAALASWRYCPAGVLPEGLREDLQQALGEEEVQAAVSNLLACHILEEVPGQVYPTQAGIVIETEGSAEASGQNSVLANGMGGNATAAGTGSGESFPENAGAAAETGAASMQGAGTETGAATAQGTGTETGAAALDAPDRGAGTGTSDTQDRGAGTGASDAQGANAGTGASDAQGANAGTGTSALQEAAPVQIPADAVQYTVKKGETLYGICMERYRSMEPIGQICQWNGLADENRLSAGQELYLPAVGN